MLILIADDERLARFTLKSMLGELLSLPYIVIEARDGRDFVEQCRARRPDIAFVDINMPLLDGISAIEQCVSELPLTRFVITTGYSDFAYAQKCISLGVTEYLLKPLEAEKLSTLLQQLIERGDAERRLSNSAFEVRVLHYFQSMDEIGSCDETEGDSDGNYTLFEFFIDGAQQPALYAERYRSLRGALTRAAAELLDGGARYALFHSPEGNLRVVTGCLPEQQTRAEQVFDRVCRTESNSRVIVSALFVQGEQPAALYKNASDLSAAAWRRYGKLPAHVHAFSGGGDDGFLRTLDRALAGFAASDEVGFTNAARELRGCTPEAERQLSNALFYINAVTGCTVGAGDAKQLAAALLEIAPRMYRGVAREVEIDKIAQVKAYIDAHFAEDSSINLLAERFSLTPNYLSRLFREKTGERFVDYLTKVRIANAKRILKQNPTALVKDIAVMVGYYSARHFSATFKRETGLYPAEFRDSEV